MRSEAPGLPALGQVDPLSGGLSAARGWGRGMRGADLAIPRPLAACPRRGQDSRRGPASLPQSAPPSMPQPHPECVGAHPQPVQGWSERGGVLMAQTGTAGPVVLRPGALQDGQRGGLLYSQQPERGGPHRGGECPLATGPAPARQPSRDSVWAAWPGLQVMEPFTASSWTMSGPQDSNPLISLQTLKLPLNLRLLGQESNK